MAAYEDFIKTENVPVHSAFSLEDLPGIPVSDWERVGGRGTYIHLDGRGPSNAFITEIPPGSSLKEQRHFYEESTFVVDGSGRTEIWNDGGFSAAFNWERGAVFAIPLNTHYVHHNVDDSRPARLFSISNMPLMMNLTRDPELIFGLEHDFQDRFNPTLTDFKRPAEAIEGKENRDRPFVGNLVPSAYDVALLDRPDRGGGGRILALNLANTTLGAHISEFPSGSYKKAHRHGAGAHVILLNGTGYSLLWKNNEEPMRVDWRPGCVLVPPDKVFHQHFNTGTSPARYLALRFSGGLFPDDARQIYVPTRLGGDQIEYEDESPTIKQMFEQELAKASR